MIWMSRACYTISYINIVICPKNISRFLGIEVIWRIPICHDHLKFGPLSYFQIPTLLTSPLKLNATVYVRKSNSIIDQSPDLDSYIYKPPIAFCLIGNLSQLESRPINTCNGNTTQIGCSSKCVSLWAMEIMYCVL